MSFKSQNNYWRASIHSEPEFAQQPTVLSISVSTTDTYITNEAPNHNKIQIFNNGTEEFQTIAERFSPEPLLMYPPQDSRGFFIRRKTTLARGQVTEVEVAIGTEEPPATTDDQPTVPKDCSDALQRVDDGIRTWQKELTDCLLNSPGNDLEKEYIRCRNECINQLDSDIRDWLRDCPTTDGKEPERPPAGYVCDGSSPPWDWHGASPECQSKWCELVQKYVRCIGGQDICRYNPCTGASADPYGGDGNDEAPFPPSIFAKQSECWDKHKDLDPTKTGGRDIYGPEDEVAGSPCWRDYYKKLYDAQCEASKICDEDQAVLYCCNSLLWRTQDYCESLGCFVDREVPGIWSCSGQNRIACLTYRYLNQQAFHECLLNLAVSHCTDLHPEDEKARNECIARWKWYAYKHHNFKAHQDCMDLARAIYEYNYSIAQNNSDRDRAFQQYKADKQKCDEDHQQWQRDTGAYTGLSSNM